MSFLSRPVLSRPLLVTKNVREAALAARGAGVEVSRSVGKWTLFTASTEACFEGRPVRRQGFGHDDVIGHFDSLDRVLHHCRGALDH